MSKKSHKKHKHNRRTAETMQLKLAKKAIKVGFPALVSVTNTWAETLKDVTISMNKRTQEEQTARLATVSHVGEPAVLAMLKSDEIVALRRLEVLENLCQDLGALITVHREISPREEREFALRERTLAHNEKERELEEAEFAERKAAALHRREELARVTALPAGRRTSGSNSTNGTTPYNDDVDDDDDDNAPTA